MAFLFFTISTATETVQALEMTEIELNPLGTDSGNEWVELYSPTNINLEGYFLVNSKGKVFNLTGQLEGYRTFLVPTGNWLVNANASVFLMEGNTILQRALFLEDDANNNQSWNYCSETWVFASSTPGQENTCGNSNEPNEQQPEEETEEENEEEQEDSSSTQSNVVETTPLQTTTNASMPRVRPKIVVGSDLEEPTSKEIVTSEGFVRDSVIYVFAGLCVTLIIFLLLRKT